MVGACRWSLLVTVFGVSLLSTAQDSTLYVYGKVRNYATGQAPFGYEVLAVNVRDTTDALRARTDAKGKFELVMHADRVYALIYRAPDFTPKHMLFDLRGPSAAQWKDGFAMNVDMALVRVMPGLDASVFDEPVGRCGFNMNSGQFEWDQAYSEFRRPKLKQFTDSLERRAPTIAPDLPPLDIPVVLPK
ncbi:MAG: hypothetical protein IPN38_01470 [Flavobacteriales bacterium]|nr:hypothetical protein [Flavobacteriales bacterium]MBL0034737.1 hypothetical protein [Flavobacteriales bacterium]